ncbi:hypothetical protein Trydic_g10546 [Trypoxylus dichotomus]
MLLIQRQDWSLIPKDGTYPCSRCQNPLCYCRSAKREDGLLRICNGKVSLRKQQAKKSKLDASQILVFAHMWVQMNKLSTMASATEMSVRTAVNWASFCREMVLAAFIKAPQKLRSENIVEIDESKFGRRKYQGGHPVEGQWAFGGYERDTGRVFKVPVPDRGAGTLLPIIKEWILPSTTIISDYWQAYDCLTEEGYEHLKTQYWMRQETQLTPKCRKLYGKAKRFSRSMRLMRARRNLYKVKFRIRQLKEELIPEITANFDPMVSKFLRNQIIPNETLPPDRRFTLDDKGLILQKQSGRGYRFLSRIFIFPSRRPLRRLLSNPDRIK